jgi:hypothetical protein
VRLEGDRGAMLTAVAAFIMENPWAHLVVARVRHGRPDVEVEEVPHRLQLTALGHTGWDILSQTLDEHANVIPRDDTRAALLWHVHAGKALRWWPAS